jgi:hypothetical protein
VVTEAGSTNPVVVMSAKTLAEITAQSPVIIPANHFLFE